MSSRNSENLNAPSNPAPPLAASAWGTLLSLGKELSVLEQQWNLREPARASGGVIAIRGFHYQFLVVLLESLKWWNEAPEELRGYPTVFGQILSDAVALTPQAIVATQVKRSLTASTLQRALEELWAIHRLACQETPELLHRLRHVVVAAQKTIHNIAERLALWTPDGYHDDDPLVTRFREVITVKFASNPLDDLLALLANSFRAAEPLEQVHAWLGRMVSAGGARDVARSIWSDLQKLEAHATARRPDGIYVWTAVDHPPALVKGGQVLTGQPVRVHHLREGYFCPRDDLPNPVGASFRRSSSMPTAELATRALPV
jgi:hypothetical protein